MVEPVKDKSFHIVEKEIPELTFSTEFMAGLSLQPELARSVAICGHLHHGKTLLCDMLISATHNPGEWPLDKEIKYTDNRLDEIDRQLSIKATPFTVVL